MNLNTEICGNKTLFQLISEQRTAIMGFAALWVLYFHTGAEMLTSVPIIGKIESYFRFIGYAGVDIFFFLSGMGIYSSLERSSLSVFYKKRVRKLIIPWLITVILYGVIVPQSLKDLICNFFFINYFIQSVHSPLWFIPSITICYVFSPMFHRLFVPCKNKALFGVLSLAAVYVLAYLTQGWIRIDFFLFILRIPVFITGMLFSYFGKNNKNAFCIKHLLLAVLFIIIGLFLNHESNFGDIPRLFPHPEGKCITPNILLAIGICPVLAAFLYFLKPENLIKRILDFYGVLSLELYCIQELLYIEIIPDSMYSWNPLLFNIVFLIIVTLCAKLMHIVVVRLNKTIFLTPVRT